MSNDPKGYYKQLELPSDATEKQIKEAFRRLAKKYHPDRNTASDAKHAFQKLNEAYETLGNAQARAKYDSSAFDAETVEARQTEANSYKPPPEPIKCACCGKTTAQPRYVVFWKITSFIMVSVRTPIQGIFCRKCANATAFKANLHSAFLGWWSIHGIFLTPVVLFRNALGGQQDKDVNEKLAYYNATTFFRRRQFDLAYALAKPLRFSVVDRYNEGARLICQIIEREQLADTARELKDTWKFSFASSAKAIAPGVLVVLTVLGVIFADDIGGVTRPPSRLATSPALNTAGLAPIQQTAPTFRPVQTAPVSPGCTPLNGTILGGYYQAANRGHSVSVKNGSNTDAVVKLKDQTGYTYVSFYVRQNGSAEINGIRDGQYKIQFAYVDGLANDCKTLSGIKSAKDFPTIEDLRTKYSAGYVEWAQLSFTLHSVAGGNVKTGSIDVKDFLKD